MQKTEGFCLILPGNSLESNHISSHGSTLTVQIHPSWFQTLKGEFEKPYWHELTTFVKEEYKRGSCCPEGKNIFRAFDMTPFDQVKVIILGQDPYHTPGAAMGMSFSVPNGSKPQPSLRNIFKELDTDLGIHRTSTDLSDWASEGVLLLNAVLTVRVGEPASHSGKGWEIFTDRVISLLSEHRKNLVFILWGNFAISKKKLIDTNQHHVITSPHPSPFSAHNGFFGSRPFSRTNLFLQSQGIEEVFWGK